MSTRHVTQFVNNTFTFSELHQRIMRSRNSDMASAANGNPHVQVPNAHKGYFIIMRTMVTDNELFVCNKFDIMLL